MGRWAALADPSFDFDASFKRFTDGYKIPIEVEKSVRGSRAGELIARCIVETGTSTYYTALADALFLIGFALWRLRRFLQRKPDTDPPHFLADSFRHSVFATGFKPRPVENPALQEPKQP